jgi:ubiquinone/menaquinone biosynthesis C-methylase UbiE
MSEQSGWQLSGNAAEAYERYIIPAFMGEWARELVRAAALRVGESVLDLACGTGVVARSAASVLGETGHVVGMDVNASMLAMARAVPIPPGASISWQHSDAAAIAAPDASFDVLLCQQGLQYFAQRAAALREMRRVLRPGGRLALSVWRPLDRQPFFIAVVAALEAHVSAEVASLIRVAFSLGNAEELRGLIAEAGFQSPHIGLEVKQMRYPSLAEFLPGYLAGSPMAAAVAALPGSRRAALFEDLQSALHSYVDDSGLAVPLQCNVVVAQA